MPAEKTNMIDIQQQVADFDNERGWNQVEVAHIVLHLQEELGEVAREVLHQVAYKTPDPDAPARLRGELADLTILLLKLANHLDIDLEAAVHAKLMTLHSRFPLEASREAVRVYEAMQKNGADNQ
jgi:dCTP diphosphatase